MDDPSGAFHRLLQLPGPPPTLEDRIALQAAHHSIDATALPEADRQEAVVDFYASKWPGFALVGEQRNDPIDLVPYDPIWPIRFVSWRDRFREALGDTARVIEHVGSTAVPGLSSKAIIDIQVSVGDLEAEDAYIDAIQRQGLSLRSRDTEHRYFRAPPALPRDVHVHVCQVGGRWEHDHLLFRDYLRAHDAVRDEYGELKERLATHHRWDRLAYTEAKNDFIAGVMVDANTWRQSTA